ncbi:NAD-aldehyde dehydrogenase [Sistotremastrum niveocremeum HHB9708]|uniref:Aldehyde dehydrogenase n=1 Tax=Sistotremastrum niveocremeum HHB9708 TaxID=1314777 RepID=A0A164ZRM6_9AGAM|nr:NAD-aldehyde dehydrogenase [Sistotremastrum niveocremeum HHB9708]
MATTLKYTPVDEIPAIREQLVQGFLSGKTRSIKFRKTQLLQLCYMIQDNLDRFKEALRLDLGRHTLEASFLDLGGAIKEALTAYKNVEKWAKPESPPFSMDYFPMKPTIRKEPKGVVLIITPFNYPIFLAYSPIAGAIAAGNTVLLKPSESSPACSALLEELGSKYLDPSVFRVVQGAVPETTKLLELQWDHSNGAVAKIVSTAAAKHLTPITLELGGKCPAVVDPNCDLGVTARRLLWGKFANAGQTCVAPDYVLVPAKFQDALVDAMVKEYHNFYPTGTTTTPSVSRIINERHTERIKKLMDATQGDVVVGGETNVSQRFIAPTIVKNVTGDDSLMTEELFGPVLPIVPVPSIESAIEFVNARDHPLALYVFTKDPKVKAKVFDNTRSGSAVANEILIQVVADGLPFGGIGPSGQGAHTGKYSFDTFTHLRSTLDSPGWVDFILGGRFPPYTSKKEKALDKLNYPKLPPRPGNAASSWNKWLSILFISSVILAFRSKFSGLKLIGSH